MGEDKFFRDADEICEYLMIYHNNEKDAVKSGKICELYNVTKEGLRQIVNYLRSKGDPICSSYKGYWYSDRIEDIDKTLAHLEGRVKGINRAIKGLKAIKDKKKQ